MKLVARNENITAIRIFASLRWLVRVLMKLQPSHLPNFQPLLAFQYLALSALISCCPLFHCFCFAEKVVQFTQQPGRGSRTLCLYHIANRLASIYLYLCCLVDVCTVNQVDREFLYGSRLHWRPFDPWCLDVLIIGSCQTTF